MGIGTTTPSQSIDIEGTFRLGAGTPGNAENKPRSVDYTSRSLSISSDNGQIIYAPIAATRSVGGYRPGSDFLIAQLNPENTILRISFVCYVHQSNDTNQSDQSSYTYGDFTVIGAGSASHVRFVDVNIKGYNGQAKTLTSNTDTMIEWNNRNNTKFRIVLDQTTGALSVQNELVTLSYMFQLFGGM